MPKPAQQTEGGKSYNFVNLFCQKSIIMNLQNLHANIYLVRDQHIMLDSDLAELYQLPTKRINEAVKRNPNRFPQDFMFRINQNEWAHLKSQNATSSWGGRRTLPYCFTEHGVLMLSSVLKSSANG